MIKGTLGVVLGLGVLVGLTFMSYWSYSYFAPRYTAVDNKVFHESQAYNDGMVRDLENIELQYNSATPEQKQALRSVAIHRFEIYPEDRLPPDLRAFYDQLKSGVN